MVRTSELVINLSRQSLGSHPDSLLQRGGGDRIGTVGRSSELGGASRGEAHRNTLPADQVMVMRTNLHWLTMVASSQRRSRRAGAARFLE